MFGGTWVQITGRVLVAAGTSDATYSAGSTGGASRVTLSVNEMPKHDGHTGSFITPGEISDGEKTGKGYIAFMNSGAFSEYGRGGFYGTAGNEIGPAHIEVGGSSSHQNMPPYYVVYMWRRTA